MPRKCCIPNCNVSNYDPLYSSVTFHTVPKNAVEREKWTQSIENNFPLNMKKYFYICSLHFDEDCFYYAHNCKYRRIKKGSYPTKFYDVQEEFIQSIKCISLSDVENVQEFDECVDDETENDLEDDSKTCEPQESVAVAEICNHETKAIVEQINYDSEQILKLKKDPTEDFVASAHENSLHTKTVKCINSKCSETIIKKSIINIDVDSIDITEQNTAQIKNILHQAKNEVAILRRKNKALAMTIFRSKKKVKNSKSLLNHIKQRKFISEELYEVLEVSKIKLHKNTHFIQ